MRLPSWLWPSRTDRETTAAVRLGRVLHWLSLAVAILIVGAGTNEAANSWSENRWKAAASESNQAEFDRDFDKYLATLKRLGEMEAAGRSRASMDQYAISQGYSPEPNFAQVISFTSGKKEGESLAPYIARPEPAIIHMTDMSEAPKTLALSLLFAAIALTIGRGFRYILANE